LKTIHIPELHALLAAQGVPDVHYAFRCPICKTIQSAADLIAAGAGKNFDEVQRFLGFSCVGRFTDAGPHRKDEPPGRGCNWTLGGLFQLHELEVVSADGKRHPMFEIATRAEAQEHMRAREAT